MPTINSSRQPVPDQISQHSCSGGDFPVPGTRKTLLELSTYPQAYNFVIWQHKLMKYDSIDCVVFEEYNDIRIFIETLVILASVRHPRTLITILTTSCVRGLLSPAALTVRARAALWGVVLLLCISTKKWPIIYLYKPLMYFLSNITWMVTPATCALSIFPSTCVFVIASEFYLYKVTSDNLPLIRHN